MSLEVVAGRVVVPCVLAALAGSALHRSLEADVLVYGILIGVVAGVVVGLVPVVFGGRRLLAWVAGVVVVVVAFVVSARAWRGPLVIPSVVGDFLVIRLPAAGLSGLAVIPTLIVVPAAAGAVAAARSGRTMLSIAVPLVALLAASAIVVPLGTGPVVPLAFAGVAAIVLLLDARHQIVRIEPLVGATSSQTDRSFDGRSLVPVAVALIVAATATVIPIRPALDVRDLVVPDSIEVRDPNPLAVTARLRLNAGRQSDTAASAVSVTGESPGRLRLAVLDRYTVDGWEQDATFAVTGSALDPGPILAGPSTDKRVRTTVTVRPGAEQSQFAGVPTGGSPISVADPNGVRYSSTAGVLLGNDWTAPVTYAALVRTGDRPTVLEAPSELAPAGLSKCPASATLLSTANVLAGGVVGPLDRLARIEAWLKLKRIYDPTAPGGQTLRSVEMFLDQDFARGNLEMFVTSYALLARCAGVAVRIVVGYLPPAAATTTNYLASDIHAWIETPLARSGWVTLDPIPTPAEQQRQAQVARQPTTDPTPAVPAQQPTARPVTPLAVQSNPSTLAQNSSAVLAVLALLGTGWAFGLPAMTDRRRRRSRDPGAAVLGAWSSVTDRLIDSGVTLGPHWTPHEIVTHTAATVPFSVTRMATELRPLVDMARYGGDMVQAEHAQRSWALRDEIVRIAPHRYRRPTQTLIHPLRAVQRYRSSRTTESGNIRWTGTLPAELVATTAAGAVTISGVELETLLGSGATSDVYRARRTADGRRLAVKVFKYAVTDTLDSQQRFEWEARVAKLASGVANLPEIYDSGVTDSGLAYLTMKLYEHGTLLQRVRRGGPLSLGEVRTTGVGLAAALETLHQNGILHGDIKPENIFIGDDAGLVLGDLGSAWLRADGGPAAAMTPPYAAPEVWRGQPPTVASDIYSLGVTLLFAATGRVPIAGMAIDIADITEAFGDDELASLFAVDPRRRPRRAIDIARLLGADVDSPLAATSATLSLPNPTFTYHPSRSD